VSELLRPGQTFAGKYRVERFLAHGGFGAVYAALHTETELRVALKVLWPHVLQSQEAVEQFKLEARVAGRVGSEHIVRVFDAGLDEVTRMPYLVMELLEGQDLETVVKAEGGLPAERLVEYFRQIASALDRAHRHVDSNGALQPIVHRDLKPENLFLAQRETGEPVIKILDFGIAKVLSRSTSVTRTVKGTPLYMAYEQAIGGQITPQTDIWPLGLIAFFSMTGHHYWKTANAAEGSLTQLFAEVLSLPIDLASVRAREIGAGVELTKAFDAWFAHCVERDSVQRFATAGECAVLLARALGVKSDHQAGTPDANDADVLAPTQRSMEDPRPARASNLAATPPGVSARAGARSTSGKLHPARLVLGVAAALGMFSAGLFAHRRPPTPAREQASASGAPSPQVPPTTAPAKDSPHGSASSIAGGSSIPRLDVDMPSRVREGDILNVSISTDRKLEIAVVCLEQNGEGVLLLPSPSNERPVAAPGHDLKLPPLRSALLERGKPTAERLVVYGFADDVDFRRLVAKPLGDARRYVANADAMLAERDPERWVKREIGYVIDPR
jgi:serine/threonine-protein kinase